MTTRHGVDVASFQGLPGQWRAAAGDISFAAVKLTELQPNGTRYVNPDARADLAWLAANGKKRILYLFAHPGTTTAETVAFFVAQARSIGLRDDDMVAVDLEVNDGKNPAEVAAWTREVLALLDHDLDRTALLYTFRNFAETGNCEGCGGHPLWISDPDHPAGEPQVPAPWGSWAIHQFTITGAIDRDITAYGTAEAMAAAMGKHRAPPPATPATQPVPARPPKVKKKRVRKTIKKAASGTKKTVKAEPVMTAATANAAIAAAVVWLAAHAGLHWTVTQQHAILTIVTALSGAFAAYMTKPRNVAVMFAALSTGAVAAGAFGYHLPPAFIASDLPTIGLIVAGILRGHVTPASVVATVESSGGGVSAVT